MNTDPVYKIDYSVFIELQMYIGDTDYDNQEDIEKVREMFEFTLSLLEPSKAHDIYRAAVQAGAKMTSGYDASKHFLESWKFEDYVELRMRPTT